MRLSLKSPIKTSIGSLLLLGVSLHATDFNWDAAVSGVWDDISKWSPEGSPYVSDNATISATGSAYEVSLNNGAGYLYLVENLTLDSADATLNLGAGPFSLGVSDVVNMNSGTITGAGRTVLIDNDTVFNFNGGNVGNGNVVIDDGTLSISSNSTGVGTILFKSDHGAGFLIGDVKSGQVLDVTKYDTYGVVVSVTGFTNAGEILLGNPAAGGVGLASGAYVGPGPLVHHPETVINTGSVKIAGDTRFLTHFTNNGSVQIESDAMLEISFAESTTPGQIYDFINNDDFTIIGKIVVSNASSLWNGTAGIIAGTGIVEIEAGSSFTNAGTIAPGLSPGTLTFMGDVPFENTATLEIELGGISNYDLLQVLSGDVFLDGLLEIALINGFTPGYNDIFTILTADNITGAFDNISGNMITLPGGSFEVVQTSNQLQLIHYIPEPTSGLLILVGCSAFGLRRKRAL